jgi:RNA polymerase sigma factor (sigma-70 family)
MDAILPFVEPIYWFCLKRLSNRIDAEDLAQEILVSILEGLRRQNISNLEGYVWRVAHNRYARLIDQRQRENIVFFGDDAGFDICDNRSLDDQPSSLEEFQNAFTALHTLSSTYRDILVDYYVHEINANTIARKYGLSVASVKWRLHAGREKMKERYPKMNKTYEKINMHIMCNGSFGPNKYLNFQINKAIAVACYEKPLTIEEISMATGIPTLYLEETLEHMQYGDAIEKAGNKYQTNFIILHDVDNKKMQRKLQPEIGALTDKVWNVIEQEIHNIQNIGFYGSNFDVKKLSYILVPVIVKDAADQVKQNNLKLTPPARPIRKDGGNGWFIVTEGIERLDENYSGCNGYVYTDEMNNEKARVTYYWIGESFDENLSAFLKNYQKYAEKTDFVTGEFISSNEEEIAKLISFNLVEKIDDRYYSAIPMITERQMGKISDILFPHLDTIAKSMESWMLSLLRVYESFTPARLHDQILGNVDSYCFNAVAFVHKELQNRGKVNLPQLGQVFTSNIIYIKKS